MQNGLWFDSRNSTKQSPSLKYFLVILETSELVKLVKKKKKKKMPTMILGEKCPY